MSVPRLNRAMVLEERQATPDGAGGFADGWVALGTLWAEVKAGSGREAPFGAGLVATTTLRIVVRAAAVGAPSRPRADQRLREGTRVFHILAVAEADPEGRYLTCYAAEEVPT